MEFGILGPLTVGVDGVAVTLGSVKQRTALATLLWHANMVVSTDRLIAVLWGEEPVPSAVPSLHVYMHRLRRSLGPAGRDRIQSRPPGYLLAVRPGELDAHRFATLAEQARRADAAGDPARCVELLDQALALWRGTAFADLPEVPPLRTAAARLGEHWLAAVELRIDAALALGRHREVVGELYDLADSYPLRERFAAQLMTALYRARRQADALAVYRRTRLALCEDLGLEPGPELRDLQRAILRADDW